MKTKKSNKSKTKSKPVVRSVDHKGATGAWTAPAKTPPPPPPKKAPPPPPPRPAQVPADSILSQLPHRPNKATVIQYRLAPTDTKPGVTIVVPANAYGDFSSFKQGEVRWGYMRGPDEESDFVPLDAEGNIVDNGTDPVPAKERIKPSPSNVGATEADLPAKVTRAPVKREGVCAFIDALIMEGTRSAEAIRDLTVAKFPGRDPQATLSTVKTRPAHIKAKGLVPPPFKK